MNAIALAFVAGVSGSVGPCAAPRYLAIASLAGGASHGARVRSLLAFALGITCASVAIVASSSIVVAALAWSGALYAVLSATFLAAGAWTLLAKAHPGCTHDAPRAASAGAAFSVGAACALVPSVCCTPFLLGIGALGANTTLGANAAAAAAFAIGHLSALGTVMVGAFPLIRLGFNERIHYATQTVGGGLSLALAVYYAVLA